METDPFFDNKDKDIDKNHTLGFEFGHFTPKVYYQMIELSHDEIFPEAYPFNDSVKEELDKTRKKISKLE